MASRIHFKYLKNIYFAILVKFRLILKSQKNVRLSECEQIIFHFKARVLEIPKI